MAFEKLNKAMSIVPVLALPNFEELFMVESDAFGTGLGAILMQAKKLIFYFSQTLTDR